MLLKYITIDTQVHTHESLEIRNELINIINKEKLSRKYDFILFSVLIRCFGKLCVCTTFSLNFVIIEEY